MNKVSIIVGLYNVCSFLQEKKLACILQQTYSNLEIILVNDGSTDATLSVCKELASIDNRIIIVNKDNGGLGSARNAGLEIATGTYIWFYDVDDEAEMSLIEKCVSWMETYKAEMTIFGFWCTTPHLGTVEKICFKERIIDNNASLKSIFIDELLFVPNGNGFAWNKFYRKSFIDRYHFRFGNQRIQQDEVFNLQLYPKLSHVYISSEVLYHYYIYNSGNTRSRFIEERYSIYLSIFNKFQCFSKEWGLSDVRLESHIYNRFYNGIANAVLFNTFHPDSPHTLKEKKQIIYDILNHESTKRCLAYINLNSRLNFESKCYFNAYKKQSFYRILFWRTIFIVLRRIKRMIKSHCFSKNEATHLHQHALP